MSSTLPYSRTGVPNRVATIVCDDREVACVGDCVCVCVKSYEARSQCYEDVCVVSTQIKDTQKKVKETPLSVVKTSHTHSTNRSTLTHNLRHPWLLVA